MVIVDKYIPYRVGLPGFRRCFRLNGYIDTYLVIAGDGICL